MKSVSVHIEARWDPDIETDVPVRVVCDLCGAARTLSTAAAIAASDSEGIWVEQTQAFVDTHRCRDT